MKPHDHESAPAAGEPHSTEDLRAALAERSGRELWQSLEEVAQSEGFRALVEARFPSQVARLAEEPERRDFLKLMASSLALGGLGACTRQPAERILPYAAAPEARVPGRPQFFATAAALGGAGVGLVVESHEGRPTRVDGNPDHPSSLGGCDPLAQAALLGLYDPDRSEVVRTLGRIGTWDKFFEALEARVALARARRGAGLAILSRTVASPTLARQRAELIERLPELRWVQYEPIGRDSARAGAELAFGRDVGMRYDFARAERVVALDADVLCRGAGHLRYARDWARGRRARASGTGATGAAGATGPPGRPARTGSTRSRPRRRTRAPAPTSASRSGRPRWRPSRRPWRASSAWRARTTSRLRRRAGPGCARWPPICARTTGPAWWSPARACPRTCTRSCTRSTRRSGRQGARSTTSIRSSPCPARSSPS